MSTKAHLWAVGFDDVARADQVREKITELGWGAGRADKYLVLLDIAVVIRRPDGSFLFKPEHNGAAENIVGTTILGCLAGLMFGAPVTGAAIGTLLGGVGVATNAAVGIDDNFVREVKALMQPGSSFLFVLDEVGDMDVILHAIRGLGGKIVKTNVDLDQAKLIQSALSANAEYSTQAPS
jgi:uncharacterized membrane protein